MLTCWPDGLDHICSSISFNVKQKNAEDILQDVYHVTNLDVNNDSCVSHPLAPRFSFFFCPTTCVQMVDHFFARSCLQPLRILHRSTSRGDEGDMEVHRLGDKVFSAINCRLVQIGFRHAVITAPVLLIFAKNSNENTLKLSRDFI